MWPTLMLPGALRKATEGDNMNRQISLLIVSLLTGLASSAVGQQNVVPNDKQAAREVHAQYDCLQSTRCSRFSSTFFRQRRPCYASGYHPGSRRHSEGFR